MIRSFRCIETEAVFKRSGSKRFGAIERIALRKLIQLHAAERLEDLSVPPGNRLEPLRGARRGQWSIRVNSQWRICFEWRDGAAWNVEIVDYH